MASRAVSRGTRLRIRTSESRPRSQASVSLRRKSVLSADGALASVATVLTAMHSMPAATTVRDTLRQWDFRRDTYPAATLVREYVGRHCRRSDGRKYRTHACCEQPQDVFRGADRPLTVARQRGCRLAHYLVPLQRAANLTPWCLPHCLQASRGAAASALGDRRSKLL
jgi:hypothetical protein